MKSHVNHSIKIIESTPGISELSLEVATLHHEKLDGKGYPFNVPKEKITKYGRMIAICDIFDALTANRCYKDGYSHLKSFSILRSLAQKNHLDERLVDLFIKCMGVYPVGSLVELSSNKLAIVESRNDGDPTNPKVRSFYNALDGRYVMAEDIDLSSDEDFIVKGVRADDFDLDMNKIIEFLLMEG
jgi:HD-GYP domain-containing protein (c-di-GMP phosphodiesterase class II)